MLLHRPAPKHIPLAFQKQSIAANIATMYRDGHNHKEIAQVLEIPEEYVTACLPPF